MKHVISPAFAPFSPCLSLKYESHTTTITIGEDCTCRVQGTNGNQVKIIYSKYIKTKITEKLLPNFSNNTD